MGESRRLVQYNPQLYTSYYLDYGTTDSVIAWIDSDVILTTVVMAHNIFSEDGRVIVQGSNTFGKP